MAQETDLVEGAVLVVGCEGVLLQEVVLEEASGLQNNLVVLCQGILHFCTSLSAPCMITGDFAAGM